MRRNTNAPSSNGAPAWSSSVSGTLGAGPNQPVSSGSSFDRRVRIRHDQLRNRRNHRSAADLRPESPAAPSKTGSTNGRQPAPWRTPPSQSRASRRPAWSPHRAVSPAAALAHRRSHLPADRPHTPPSAAAGYGRRRVQPTLPRDQLEQPVAFAQRASGAATGAQSTSPNPRSAVEPRIGRLRNLVPFRRRRLPGIGAQHVQPRRRVLNLARIKDGKHLRRTRRKRRGQRQHRLLREARVIRIGRDRRLRKRHRPQALAASAQPRAPSAANRKSAAGPAAAGAAETLRTVNCAFTSSRASAGVRWQSRSLATVIAIAAPFAFVTAPCRQQIRQPADFPHRRRRLGLHRHLLRRSHPRQHDYEQCHLQSNQDPKPFRGLTAFTAGGCAVAGPIFCRSASYITTAPATDTFSDDTLPAIGIRSRWSQVFFTRSCSPAPSRAQHQAAVRFGSRSRCSSGDPAFVEARVSTRSPSSSARASGRGW